MIQRIQRLAAVPADAGKVRCQTVLADWLKHGHSEERLRALAKADAVPLEPPPERKGR